MARHMAQNGEPGERIHGKSRGLWGPGGGRLLQVRLPVPGCPQDPPPPPRLPAHVPCACRPKKADATMMTAPDVGVAIIDKR